MRYCCLNLASLCEQLQFEILWKICNHIWLKLRKNLLKIGKNCYHWRGGGVLQNSTWFSRGVGQNHVGPQKGEGVQKCPNSVHMVYGCPLKIYRLTCLAQLNYMNAYALTHIIFIIGGSFLWTIVPTSYLVSKSYYWCIKFLTTKWSIKQSRATWTINVGWLRNFLDPN